ncbi:MAG: hypothetical protein CMM01_17230 [Rhodopirellula sp.]|nr:hypothetical protein [Rhodopirellula sp.]OUX50085.1 MAG: hypothetical protein CBE43_07965 [Rhodopirellula sp. TMED283]
MIFEIPTAGNVSLNQTSLNQASLAASAPLSLWEPLFSESVAWTVWMEPTGTVLVAITVVLLCMIAWAGNLIALPGNWAAVLILLVYAFVGPATGNASIGYIPVVAAFCFALLGEGFEFVAAALGAQKAGASRKATLLAMIGSMAGAILGAIVGLPVPIVGQVLAAILFGGLGATLGAMLGEWSNGSSWRESLPIGHAAFWGRTIGTLGKVAAGAVIVVIAMISVVV